MVGIDGLQTLRSVAFETAPMTIEGEERAVGYAAELLRGLAQERGCPVIATSMVDRSAYRAGATGLEDIGVGWQHIATCASAVLALAPEPDEGEPGGDEHRMALRFLKNEYGPLGVVPLALDGAHAAFRETGGAL